MSSMEWTVETIASVDAEIEALPVALRARLVRLLEAGGECRPGGATGTARQTSRGQAVGATGQGRRGHRSGNLRDGDWPASGVLHVFAKKSRKTPRRALETARERMRQVT